MKNIIENWTNIFQSLLAFYFLVGQTTGSSEIISNNLWRLFTEISSIDTDFILIDNKNRQLFSQYFFVFNEKIAVASYNDLKYKNNFGNFDLVVLIQSVSDWNVLIHMIKQLLSEKAKPCPTIFIQWPIILENESEIEFHKLKEISLFSQIDTQLFVSYTICSHMHSKKQKYSCNELSVWELYSIKNISIIKKLTHPRQYQFSKLSSRRKDFNGIPISAISPIEAGLEHIIEMSENDGIIELTGGFTVDIYRTLRDFMNFTESVVKGSGWVSQLPNGSLGGMGAQIINGEADISIPLSYLFPYRMEHLTFLQPIGADRLYAFFRKPYDGSVHEIYSDPFDIYLWLTILSTQFGLFCSIILILYAKNKTKILTEEEVNIFECENYWMMEDSLLLSTVGILSQQGWYVTPSSISSRIWVFSGMLFGLVIYSAYCAMLISGLSYDVSRINFLSDLLKHKYTMLLYHNVNPQEFIQQGFGRSSESFDKLLIKKYSNDTDALTLVLKGQHVYFKSKDSFYEQARFLNCSDKFVCDSISYIQFSEQPSKSGMFINKTSVFKEAFNFGTILILERGINDHFKNVLIQKTYTLCPKGAIKSSRVLTLQDVSTAFFGLALGFMFSLIILLIEILTVRTKKPGCIGTKK